MPVVILGLIRLLPRTLILLLGLLLVFGHDIITQFHPPAPGQPADVTTVLPPSSIRLRLGIQVTAFGVCHPPWTGIMLLGYWIGAWYIPDMTGQGRKQLLSAGLGLMALFILLRFDQQLRRSPTMG